MKDLMTGLQPINKMEAKRGALLLGAAQAYRVGLSFLSSVLLARLLTPEDFGLVAMASIVMALVALAQDLGLNQATIQRPEVSQEQINALFWTTTGFSLGLAGIVIVIAPSVGLFFADSRVVALTRAYALIILLNGIQSQVLAILNRRLRFGAIAAIDVISCTLSTTVGVFTAWLTESYWALFALGLSAAVASLICAWRFADFRLIRPSFQGQGREFLGFGAGVLGFNVVNYFARNADNILIGRIYGGEQLGYYDRAYRLLLFPLEQLRSPLGRVLVPALSRLQGNPERYSGMYLRSTSMMMLITQPGIIVMIVFSTDVFGILFGPHWLPAAPIFKWLGICALHQIMTSTVGWLYLSQGRSADLFKIGSFNAVTSVASFLIGIAWGPLGVAVAYTLSDYIVRLPITLWWTCRKGPLRLHDLILNAIPHLIAVLVTATMLEMLKATLGFLNLYNWTEIGVLSYVSYGTIMIVFPAKRDLLRYHVRTFAGMLPVSGRWHVMR